MPKYEANKNLIPETAIPFLDGLLAGDGHYTKQKGKSLYSELALCLSAEKSTGFAKAILERLFELGMNGSIIQVTRKSGYKAVYVRSSFASVEFGKQRARWYNSDGTRHIPRDISNTPEMWYWLYVGDGTLLRKTEFCHVISIYTNCFLKEDVEFLSGLLLEHNIKSTLQKHKVGKYGHIEYVLKIHTEEVENFLNFIGPCNIEGYEHKWAINKKPIRICEVCKSEFLPKTYKSKFCSQKCAYIACTTGLTEPDKIEKYKQDNKERVRKSFAKMMLDPIRKARYQEKQAAYRRAKRNKQVEHNFI